MATQHTASENGDADRVLSQREILAVLPLSRSTIWRMVQAGTFPAPIRLTPGRIGWQWSAVLAWIEERKKNPVAVALNLPARKRSA
jgi:prophage regulatory protein